MARPTLLKLGITPITALRLAKFFGVSADFWLTLQVCWDLFKAQVAEKEALEGIQDFHHTQRTYKVLDVCYDFMTHSLFLRNGGFVMNKAILALIIGTTLSLPVTAADTYTVDSKHTFPGFEINHLGFSIQRGRFNQTSGKVTLDPQSATGSIQIAIDTASIDTGLAKLEEHLRGEDFLDATRYPKITFTSKNLNFNKD